MPTQGACSSTFVVFIVVICAVVQQGTCVTPSPTSPTPVQKPCNVRTSCEDCLANVTCLWCMTNNTCSHYPVSSIIPPSSVCSLSQARWGVCWVNFEALIITMAVVVGTILLSVMVCCCCCYCCRKSSSGSPDRDEERLARRREEARQRSDDRRVDRKARHDEIRKKYGLVPDADHPYSKFENE
ncbi:pituitary tumor-transforming gene 1 protein-interacting protein isoform X1 [Alosa pseudoharengus]|uniref:pituitary tumor-transforming gene 1 protein-interacting protein isoform X1 n=1 Tax=Alosa sapidissima TaxID=34773 RepID=UPI001C08246F|nr:pituitary tumor-transforming gene 1 protein-interacting protein isoform X1 [Alosa sapidissima]